MKKLLIILFCLPLIGLGQITVTEVKKQQNNMEFTKNLSYSIKSGLGIEIFPGNIMSTTTSSTFFSYYLIPNVNYNISINNKLGIYNTISLPIILRNRKKRDLELDDIPVSSPFDMQGEERYYLTTLIAKIEYNVGVEAEITEDLQGRLGIIIPIYGVQTINQDLGNYSSYRQWGAGFNVELDYSLTDNLCTSLSVSRELMWNNLQSNLAYNKWVTEILIGVNYKL
tara:strand:+ start:163 stop:840 length:678 start_codon:yes stop_codon:yes gene_type:complete